MKNLYILHEFGSKSHYRALTWYAENEGHLKIIFREFSIFKLLVTSIFRADIKLFLKQFSNLASLFSLSVSSNKIIVIGIAPYDWRLILYYPFLKKHLIFYHTSKTSWGYKYYSKRFLAKTKISKYIWTSFINNSNGIFCASEKVKKELLKHYNPKRLSVVNHSIKSSYLEKVQKTDKGKKLRCLFVGRLEESKGISTIFHLINNLPEDQFEFDFVGTGNMQKEIIEFCTTKKNCSLLGFQKDPQLKRIFENADILLVPSIKSGPWEELFGMVLIEGMARGTVPIATNHSGPKEIIQHGHSGFYFSEEEFLYQTTNLLINLLNNNPKLQALKTNTILAGQSYSPELIFKKWNSLLELNYE